MDLIGLVDFNWNNKLVVVFLSVFILRNIQFLVIDLDAKPDLRQTQIII